MGEIYREKESKGSIERREGERVRGRERERERESASWQHFLNKEFLFK